MSGDYWLGVLTPFALVLVGYLVLTVGMWVAWWFADRDKSFWGGWGFVHDFECFDDNERWSRRRHTHYWPPDTPRWLGRLLEPLRVWHCERQPDHSPTSRRASVEGGER